MTWKRVLMLTGLAALLLAAAAATVLIGERSGWPKDGYAAVSGVLAFAGLVVFGFGTFAPITAWVLLPLYEKMLGADDGRLALMRFLSPSRRGAGRE